MLSFKLVLLQTLRLSLPLQKRQGQCQPALFNYMSAFIVFGRGNQLPVHVKNVPKETRRLPNAVNHFLQIPSWGIPLSKVWDGKWNEIQTHCVIVYMNSFNFSLEGLSHPNVQWRFRLTVWLQVWSNYTHVPVRWPESACDVLKFTDRFQSPNSTCKALKIPQVYLDATLQAVCTYKIRHQHSYRFIWSLHLLHLLPIVVFWVSIYPANTWRQQQGVNISKPDFARSLQFPLMLRPHQPKQCHYYISIH